MCARASIRLACFAGTCQILVFLLRASIVMLVCGSGYLVSGLVSDMFYFLFVRFLIAYSIAQPIGFVCWIFCCHRVNHDNIQGGPKSAVLLFRVDINFATVSGRKTCCM